MKIAKNLILPCLVGLALAGHSIAEPRPGFNTEIPAKVMTPDKAMKLTVKRYVLDARYQESPSTDMTIRGAEALAEAGIGGPRM